MSRVAPLVEYLEQLQAKGETHVSLDAGAREIMRKFYVRAVYGEQKPTVAASLEDTPQASKSQNTVSAVTSLEKVQGGSYSEIIAKLKGACANYGPLKQLGTLRTVLVFPTVPERAEIMFVGDAPAYHDEKKGMPFAGPAGEKLNGILKAMNLSRQMVHVSNILKYRPALPNQTTNNRLASEAELATSKPLIDQEIQAIKPKVIVTLGQVAGSFFSGSDADIDSIRQGKYEYLGIPVIPTYHPSFLLHSQETSDKRALWEDMLKVMELLGMPISDKQRGYFVPKG